MDKEDIIHIVNRTLSLLFILLAVIILIISIVFGSDKVVIYSLLNLLLIAFIQILGYSGWVFVYYKFIRIKRSRAIAMSNMNCIVSLVVSSFFSYIS